jgi:hypothetical protein
MMARKNCPEQFEARYVLMADHSNLQSRRIIQESGSAFQIGSGNTPEQADGVS